MTTNGRGLVDFKRGAFDIGAPVKLCGLKYGENSLNPCLSFMGFIDCSFLLVCQFSNSLEFVELSGNYYPEEFVGWKDFAGKVKGLMCRELGFEDFQGTLREKKYLEEEIATINMKY